MRRGRKTHTSRRASTRDPPRRGKLTPPSFPFTVTTFTAKLDAFERQKAFARNMSCAPPPRRCISFAIAPLPSCTSVLVRGLVCNWLLWGSFLVLPLLAGKSRWDPCPHRRPRPALVVRAAPSVTLSNAVCSTWIGLGSPIVLTQAWTAACSTKSAVFNCEWFNVSVSPPLHPLPSRLCVHALPPPAAPTTSVFIRIGVSMHIALVRITRGTPCCVIVRFLPDRAVRSFADEVFQEMTANKEPEKLTAAEVTAMVSFVLDSSTFLFPSWSTHSPSFLA